VWAFIGSSGERGMEEREGRKGLEGQGDEIGGREKEDRERRKGEEVIKRIRGEGEKKGKEE
jgi:hypothetical protein